MCLHLHVCIVAFVATMVLSDTGLSNFQDNQLATAPTNGSVILWDLSKETKSKIGKLCFVVVVQIVGNVYNGIPIINQIHVATSIALEMATMGACVEYLKVPFW